MAKTAEQLTKAIDAKLQLLELTQDQTTSAIEKKNITSVERLRNTLKKKVEEVHDFKTTVQEMMFEAGKKEEEILKWSVNIEQGVGEFEKTIDHLSAAIKEFQSSETQAAEKEEEERAAQLREKKYEEEMRFEKAKLEQKLKYEKKIDEKKDQNINAKLPKLVITHFKGTPADWLRFWGQFSAEIDATYFQNHEVYLPQGTFGATSSILNRWPPVYHRRLRTSEEYTKNKIWKRK